MHSSCLSLSVSTPPPLNMAGSACSSSSSRSASLRFCCYMQPLSLTSRAPPTLTPLSKRACSACVSTRRGSAAAPPPPAAPGRCWTPWMCCLAAGHAGAQGPVAPSAGPPAAVAAQAGGRRAPARTAAAAAHGILGLPAVWAPRGRPRARPCPGPARRRSARRRPAARSRRPGYLQSKACLITSTSLCVVWHVWDIHATMVCIMSVLGSGLNLARAC